MLIFLAFSLLTEIWVCTHYSISHFASLLISGGWWLILGRGPSNRRRWRLHCQSNQCLQRFLTERCVSKIQGSKGEFGKIRRGTAPCFPWQRAVQDRNRNPNFQCVTDMASSEHCNQGAIVNVCPEGLYFATCLQVKGHPSPAQFDNATPIKLSFNSPNCLNSWHFYVLPSTLNYTEEIPFSKNTQQASDSAERSPSTSLHLSPFIPVVAQPHPDQFPLGNTSPESWCVGDGYASLGKNSLAS